tara:strand:- start:363 stop:491 length:129 start_codon:yes stop_codon:yes gene_type:complete
MGRLYVYPGIASPLVSMAPYLAPFGFYIDDPVYSVVAITKMS